MSLKKRGLGRGLEALLAESSDKEESSRLNNDPERNSSAVLERQASEVMVDIESVQDGLLLNQSAMAIALVKNIQRENLLLQEEALVLKSMLDEFEQLLKGG